MIKENIEITDNLIRNGRVQEARKVLRTFVATQSKGLPRSALVPVAALYRRTGQFSESVKLLHSIVRPSPRSYVKSTAQERAEYAGSLLQWGALKEAQQILATVPESEVPRAALFSAFACFAEWNYAAAIPVLQRYIGNPLISDYERKIGEVNLAAAYVIDRAPASAKDPLIDRLLESTSNQSQVLLHGNILEIAAQDAIYSGDYGRARTLLQQVPSPDNLMVKKWRAITKALSGDQEEGQKNLLHVKKLAEVRRDWETLRECDLFLGSIFQDRKLLTKVYLMTPFEHYRTRIEKISKQKFSTVNSEMELGTGKLEINLSLTYANELDLKAGSLPSRLLIAMLADGYKPQTIPALHAKLFPQNHFNPLSSPQQVHQTLQRLKKQLSFHLPILRIKEERGAYQFSVRKNVRLKIQAFTEKFSADPQEEFMLLALLQSRKNNITSREAAKIWNISLRSANRALWKLCESGKMKKLGAGRKTHFLVEVTVRKSITAGMILS